MRRLASTSLLVLLMACGGGGGGGGTPAPTPTPTPPPPSDNWVINGQVVAYGSGAPISGARVAPTSGNIATTDGSGAFRLSALQPPLLQPIPVKVEADGYVTRELFLRYQAGTRDGVTVDLIRRAPPFSESFFNALVRNAYEEPGELQPNWRLETSPKFYVRTVDQNGRAVEPEVLAVVLPAIRKAVTDWTGGVLSVTTLETGTRTRSRAEGWIVVNITRNYSSEYCGLAYIGSTQGEIELVNDRCNCGSNKISGAIVAHEVGHALGFWHVGDRGSLMYPYVPGNCPPGNLSANERYHSRLAYSRTRGNVDPDSDPPWGARISAPAASGIDRVIVN